jgi:predicted RNA-binding protein with PIN domain
MPDRLIVIDGYNLVHRTPQLKPGVDGRTLRDSRDKLVNLLSWMMGGEGAQFLVVFDGAEEAGRDERSGKVQVRWSRPPEKADDLIRRIVEDQAGRVDRLTVVTADLEVARHARAMGADIAMSDLFLASALGGGARAESEKPATLSRKELEDWAELFRNRKPRAEAEEE